MKKVESLHVGAVVLTRTAVHDVLSGEIGEVIDATDPFVLKVEFASGQTYLVPVTHLEEIC